MDHLLSKETWKTIARAGVHAAPGDPSPTAVPDREATSARPSRPPRRLPSRVRTTRVTARRSIEPPRGSGAGCMTRPRASRSLSVPHRVRGVAGPRGAAPPPGRWPGAWAFGPAHRSFTIRRLVTHASECFSLEVVVAQDSSTNVDPYGSAWDLNHPMRGSLLRGPERRETRRMPPTGWDSWHARSRHRDPLGDRGGVGSAWSSP